MSSRNDPAGLKVLHVVGGYPTEAKPGHQVFIKTQVDSLIEAGINCDVLLLEGDGSRKYLRGRPQIRRALQAQKYDLIHAHYSYCGLVSLFHGLPVVTSFQGSDLYGFACSDGTYPWLTKFIHLNLSRWTARYSREAIVKAESMRRDLSMALHVVPNGVDFRNFLPLTKQERTDLRAKLGLRPDTRYVLFGSDPARALKRFPLAGAAVEMAAAQLDGPVELLPVSGRPHSVVVQHMQACDALILTSTSEGSPNVVKEAMAANLPVVSVNVGDTFERLNGVTRCRVTADDRPDTIARALVDVLDSEENCGGREAIAPLEMSRVAERVIEIYRAALA